MLSENTPPLSLIVADHVSAMLAYWDKLLICRFANQAYLDWFGVSPDDMIGKMTLPELLGSLYEKNLPYIQAVLGGEPQVFEREIPVASGGVRYSIANYYPDLIDKEVKGFFVHVADISEQKQAEHLLREDARKRQQLLGSIPHLIWVTNKHGKCTFLNQQWQEYVGSAASNPNAIDFLSLVHEEDQPYIRKQQALSLQTGKPFEATFRLRSYTGEYRWKLGRTLPVFNDQGELIERIGTATDIHEQKMAQAAAEESERSFRFLTNMIPQIVWTTNVRGEVDYVNERWQTYTGMTLEQTLSQGWTTLLHLDDISSTFQAWKDSLDTGKDFKVEQRIRNQHGEYRWMLSRASPLKDASGQIIRWFGSSSDIHSEKLYLEELNQVHLQMKRKNDDLSQVNVDLDNFVYTASHDLRAPVASLIGLQRLLARKLKDRLSANEMELMDYLSTSALKLNHMIEALGKIARSQQEVLEQYELIAFTDILLDVETNLRPLIKEKQVQVKMSLHADSVYFIRKYLYSILYNLVSNALKYSADDRSPLVHIQTWQEDGIVCLSVKDNGLGIRPEQLAGIFAPFRRFHTHVEGTGVGLYIIKRTIENYGGRITVESEVGVGTTFEVFFKSPFTH